MDLTNYLILRTKEKMVLEAKLNNASLISKMEQNNQINKSSDQTEVAVPDSAQNLNVDLDL